MPALLPMRTKLTSTPKPDSDLLLQLDRTRIPSHVAIIMDGNGRWAKRRHMPRILGHRTGVNSVREVVRAATEIGVKHLTLYAFSSENWSRPTTEIKALMHLLEEFLEKELPELQENGVRLRAIGRIEGLPESSQRWLARVMEQTSQNQALCLNLALNYGGRQEIVDACNRAWKAGVRELDEKTIQRFLYASDAPDPDLLIRTSGEMRISNFLLWEMAYTEFHITSVLWPEFRRRHFLEAILDYQRRERRFGGI